LAPPSRNKPAAAAVTKGSTRAAAAAQHAKRWLTKDYIKRGSLRELNSGVAYPSRHTDPLIARRPNIRQRAATLPAHGRKC
jgi:hypothetical protein